MTNIIHAVCHRDWQTWSFRRLGLGVTGIFTGSFTLLVLVVLVVRLTRSFKLDPTVNSTTVALHLGVSPLMCYEHCATSLAAVSLRRQPAARDVQPPPDDMARAASPPRGEAPGRCRRRQSHGGPAGGGGCADRSQQSCGAPTTRAASAAPGAPLWRRGGHHVQRLWRGELTCCCPSSGPSTAI